MNIALMQVEEAEGIFYFLSEPEKRQALQFLLSVFRRYNSSIVPVLDTSRSSESCKTAKAKELGDVIKTFSLLLEKQISKLEDGLEKSVTDGVEQCLSVEPACESNGEDKQQHTVYTYSVTENTGNEEKQSYSLQHLPPNRSKNLFERIYSPLFTWENTKFDRLEHRKRKPIERRQPIKLLVKTAYKQDLLKMEKLHAWEKMTENKISLAYSVMINFPRKLLIYSTWCLSTDLALVVVDSVINCSHLLSQSKLTTRSAANQTIFKL